MRRLRHLCVDTPIPIERFTGVLLGTAVGDAVALPFEGLSRRRVRRMVGEGPIEHRLVLGRGMVSDDTEHACMVAAALLRSDGDPARFARSLAWRLRAWLLGLPAGIGKATALAIGKLWLGVPPRRSGVRSAGNGPAMRAAVIGVYAAGDAARTAELVRASTRLTHTDPRAEQGALAVALAAGYAAARDPSDVNAGDLLELLRPHVSDAGLASRVETACRYAANRRQADELADALGLAHGVSGFVNDTVPFALFCWLRWPRDVRAAVEAAVRAGGDTDSVAAIVGGLAGATLGDTAIPPTWLAGIVEWPRSVGWMRSLASDLHRAAVEADDVRCTSSGARLLLFPPGLIIRNVVFLAIVLAHGFRRLLPPY